MAAPHNDHRSGVTVNHPAPLTSKRTFVLLHGAWRGGCCYSAVAELLRSRGHRVFTPTLSGLGERSHLANFCTINLSTHVQDILNVLHWENLDGVILCGHSYGGVVITAVADAVVHRIAALVYIDAIVPEAQQSVLMMNRSEHVVAAILSSAAATGAVLVPALPSSMLGTAERHRVWVERLSTPHPLASFCEPVTLTGAWRAVPAKTYIRATGWPGYESLGFHSYEAVRTEPDWRTCEVPCGHEVMIDDPDTLAGILADIH
jgi:pimeloyl-ACP methyl ester carboxylesterase